MLRQEKCYGANSPDLNPADYQIWGKMQQRVYRSQNHDVDQLQLPWIEEWGHFHQVFVNEMIRHGVHIFELAFEHTEDILNTDFSYVRYLYCSCHGHVQLPLVCAPSTPLDQHPGMLYPLRFVIRQSHWEPLGRW